MVEKSMNEQCYRLFSPKKNKVPILVSVPHAGTKFPEDLVPLLHPHIIQSPEDTDWFVDELYSFVPTLGITLITASYSRYVIDLNRDWQNHPLYPHTRKSTPLVPTHSFSKKPLYQQKNKEPNNKEIQNRIEKYYHPYYKKTSSLLNDLKSTFGHVLFFDAHSIKHLVPSIQATPFNQLTLSDYNGQCAPSQISNKALQRLKSDNYTLGYNTTFLGGHLIRNMSKKNEKRYGLQLEMCQNIYMNEEPPQYLSEKANQVKKLLKLLFEDLIQVMESLK